MNEPKRVSREVVAAGILFLCLLGLSLIPPLTVLVIWLMPIPLTVLTVMERRIETILFALIFGVALAVLGLNWTALLFALAAYGLSVMIGDGIKKTVSPYGVLITSSLVIIMLELVPSGTYPLDRDRYSPFPERTAATVAAGQSFTVWRHQQPEQSAAYAAGHDQN